MYIDIAFSLNRALQVPLLVVINSILCNTQVGQLSDNSGSRTAANAAIAPSEKPENPESTAPLRFNIVYHRETKAFLKTNCATPLAKPIAQRLTQQQ